MEGWRQPRSRWCGSGVAQATRAESVRNAGCLWLRWPPPSAHRAPSSRNGNVARWNLDGRETILRYGELLRRARGAGRTMTGPATYTTEQLSERARLPLESL